MKGFRRNFWRLLVLVASALLSLGFAPESCPWLGAALPRFSPILSLCGAVAARAWLGWSMLLGVPLLVLALFKGRFFCWRLCPMGFLAETVGRLNPWGKGFIRHVPTLNKVLALVVAVTAVVGYPLFIWLDPFCLFNGFFSAWRTPFTAAAASTGICFAAVLVLSIAAPDIWCHRLCPLGGLQEAVSIFVHRLRRSGEGARSPASAAPSALPRRAVLASLPAAVAGVVAERAFGPNGRKPLRPPGADLARINALCARCGNCMRACPYQLIRPDLGDSGLDGLFTPVLWLRGRNPDQEQYCFQDCVACTQVCPTGALRPLTVAEKHRRPIGLAVIDRKKCLAWEKQEYCAVCDEYCPYKAVKLVKRGEVMCPAVEPSSCRGCGACESACPADPVAIVVRPLALSRP